MVTVLVRHTVKDYAAWKPLYDQDEARRRAGGSTGVGQVYRDVDNPNIVTAVLEWESAEQAQQFTHDPALAEVMQRAGVIGQPAVVAIMSRG